MPTKNNDELLKVFEKICKLNDEFIKNKKNISPLCLIFLKDHTFTSLPLPFNHIDKEIIKNILLKKLASLSNLEGYILIMDNKLTECNRKTGITKVNDCMTRNLYTPKKVYQDFVIYENGKIIEKIDFKKKYKAAKSIDEWNLWGEHTDYTDPESKKIHEEYIKFKKNNPELFKDVL